MINAKFSIVKEILIDCGSVYFYELDEFVIEFSDTRIIALSFKDITMLYGRVLLCWLEGINTFYIILKDNSIHQLDKENRVMLNYIMQHPAIFSKLDNIRDVKTFAEL